MRLKFSSSSATSSDPDTGIRDPNSPEETARLAVVSSGIQLFLGLGAVVLLVGSLGLASVMIVAVLECRSEIGLRRSLGATRPHIAAQFPRRVGRLVRARRHG